MTKRLGALAATRAPVVPWEAAPAASPTAVAAAFGSDSTFWPQETFYPYNGTADIAFRRVTTPIYNDMWTGTGFATISSGSGLAVVGTMYCGRGKTSGYRCAQVTSTTYTPTHSGACPGGCGPNFVYATLNHGNSQGGDSGGPWANGNTAVGIHKGSDGLNVHWSKIGYRPASSNVFTG